MLTLYAEGRVGSVVGFTGMLQANFVTTHHSQTTESAVVALDVFVAWFSAGRSPLKVRLP